jgi:hypothetical protein
MPKDQKFQPHVMGDRTALSYDERMLLETKILPTARRWLDMPGLDTHGMQTLAYWGERFEIPVRLRDREEREKAGL